MGDVNDLKVRHKLGIFVLEGMVTMRGRNEDFLYAIIDKSFDIFLGQAFEYVLIAGLADAFSATTFFGAQYPEIYPSLVKNIGRSSRYLF